VSQPSHVSGTESDSDSALSPDLVSPTSQSYGSNTIPGSTSQPPLSSIAEGKSGSGEESDEDEEEEEEGGWRTATMAEKPHGSFDEKMIKSGYLWKKGERRKVRTSETFFFAIGVDSNYHRHGRNDGLCFDLHISHITRPTRNTNCYAYWISLTYIPAPQSRSRNIPIHLVLSLLSGRSISRLKVQ
jgi:hypothetical protein